MKKMDYCDLIAYFIGFCQFSGLNRKFMDEHFGIFYTSSFSCLKFSNFQIQN